MNFSEMEAVSVYVKTLPTLPILLPFLKSSQFVIAEPLLFGADHVTVFEVLEANVAVGADGVLGASAGVTVFEAED